MSEIITYKCPNCAAPITFDSTVQKMKCSSCQVEIETDGFLEYGGLMAENSDSEAGEPVWEERSGEWSKEEQEKVRNAICQSCGGEIMMDQSTIASDCPYCGNVAIVPGKASDSLKPDYIIPFKHDRNAAIKALQTFYQKKALLPDMFKERNRIDKIKGMYIPFWLYDCTTEVSAVFDAIRIRKWRRGNIEYTKTEHYAVIRNASMDFDKIPANASEKIEDLITEAVEPYNYNDLTGFSLAYLSGYFADKYEVDSEENRQRVNRRIRNSAESLVRSTVNGYDSVNTRTFNVNIANPQTGYALFPIWMLNTKYGDKVYTFAMNGQTGKLVGDLPVDAKKAVTMCSIITLILSLILAGLLFCITVSFSVLNIIQIAAGAGCLGAALSFLTYLPMFRKG